MVFRKMVLEEYKKRRKFNITPEPEAKTLKKSQSRFVIQEHNASHLHYDFRLELPPEIGSEEVVLKSWAIPKNLPQEKGVKRLAVQTEDHPVPYIDFEGEIPKGEYGAGIVKIWDKGKFKLLEREPNHIHFVLGGKKIKGEYNLIKTKGFKKTTNSWLIFKVK